MNPIKHAGFFLEYCGVRLVLCIVQCLPLRVALRLGEWVGRAAALVTPRRRRLAVENLTLAYPEMSREEADRMALKVYRHFGRAMVESAVGHRLLRPSTFRDHLVCNHAERLEKLIAEGKGAIFITAHLGAWELFGMVLRHFGAPVHIVYRPMKNPCLDRFLRKRRERFGQTMIDRKGALRPLLRVLRQKGYIAFLVDQHVRRTGIWVPFFGRPARTTPGPAALSLATGVPIILGYGCRLPGTYRFEFHVDEPMYPKRTGDRDADIERITAEITRGIERFVRKYPEQWLWMHRRWHTPPPEAATEGATHVKSSGEPG